MYPSLLMCLNCSKETKLSTLVLIDNSNRRGLVDVESIPLPPDTPNYKTFNVNDFMLDAIYTEANVMAVGERFNLPGFEGIDEWMKKRHPEVAVA